MEKKKEAETKKQEAAKAREEEKRKKIAEKEEKKKSEDESKKKKLNMQKACLRSFFSAPPEKKARKIFSGNTTKDCKSTDQSRSNSSTSAPSSSFDIDAFRSMVNSSESHDRKSLLIPKLSSQAVANRKRRTRTVTLSVYVTVMPEENAFNAQPFAEQQDIKVRNKYRFLSFHEDCRPPYHGTWSKRSTIVTGKSPFAKDTTHLDYDYDSEAEWEEGDDEIGEDIEDEEKCKDEDEDEGDARIYDYDDGFCVADDRYLDTDDSVDEETRALYKKKLQKGEGHGSLASRLCIIAPVQGGIPPSGDDFFTHLVEGFEKAEGMDLLSSHQGLELCDLRLCLDAFPPRHPAVVDEAQASAKVAVSSSGDATGRDEYSPEEMRSLARFSHHCELNSKEKLIESLRNAHPEMFTSRAKATRKLDCIAVKKRRGNASGVYWEVKKEILEELGLQDVLVSRLLLSGLVGCEVHDDLIFMFSI
jgi:chromatin assembly factor 1 subunit A